MSTIEDFLDVPDIPAVAPSSNNGDNFMVYVLIGVAVLLLVWMWYDRRKKAIPLVPAPTPSVPLVPPTHVSGGKTNGINECETEEQFVQLLQNNAVIAVVSDGCGHCKAMKPALVEAGNAAQIWTVTFSPQKEWHKTWLTKLNIQGFPTVFRCRVGKSPEFYKGNRSSADLIAFANA